MTLAIALGSPLDPALGALHARHHAAMHADTPPGSVHMLPPAALAAPQVRFFVLRVAGAVAGMGAWKRLSGEDGEIKSMHVLAEMRGQGLAQALLAHLIADARAHGVRRLFLETGAQPSFAPARALYRAAGFADCPPFEGYGPDPNSAFLCRAIDGPAGASASCAESGKQA